MISNSMKKNFVKFTKKLKYEERLSISEVLFKDFYVMEIFRYLH